MDAAPVPYENVKDNFEVEVAAANGENGDNMAEKEADPFRTDHIEVQKLVSLQAPDSPAVPLRRRKVAVVAAAPSGRGFCIYRKVTWGARSCTLSALPSSSVLLAVPYLLWLRGFSESDLQDSHNLTEYCSLL